MGTGIMHDLILVVDWLSRFRGWDPNATGIDAVGQEAAERLRKAIKS